MRHLQRRHAGRHCPEAAQAGGWRPGAGLQPRHRQSVTCRWKATYPPRRVLVIRVGLRALVVLVGLTRKLGLQGPRRIDQARRRLGAGHAEGWRRQAGQIRQGRTSSAAAPSGQRPAGPGPAPAAPPRPHPAIAWRARRRWHATTPGPHPARARPASSASRRGHGRQRPPGPADTSRPTAHQHQQRLRKCVANGKRCWKSWVASAHSAAQPPPPPEAPEKRRDKVDPAGVGSRLVPAVRASSSPEPATCRPPRPVPAAHRLASGAPPPAQLGRVANAQAHKAASTS